ncbi:DNA (cytosine-5)-methyltransferase 1 [Pseudobutyrivibrio sp. C4]|uniref:DNA (cytosine-5-)-methyltransferase n=1 Tax=Pseudobutyrivibrio sp. C4 TaxID=1520803 RepID=UPI0008B3ED36|nr:DNA (cytosine-5-)-methyltransferase [Pseudobutyrivibrio sp. C4]SET05584.1 DNA (cytosine-5)-methyltransferase 1 [Pseudobutyrivibrio sp. C4]
MGTFDNYECEGQMDIFDFLNPMGPYKIKKPIRLIELFAGIGAQAKALERLKANFEHYKISEWEVHATASYHKIHMKDDKTDYSESYTDKELVDLLDSIGISVDGKKPMSRTKIKAKGEKWHRKVYNDFMATHNIGSVTNIKGEDLGITDTNKYCYLLTYSFPCQDLSVAGKQKGMSKDSGTRSGLLWEVERLLYECKELPDVLLMENVPQVHGAKFKADFDRWCSSLEKLGYQNFWQDLNAKNYGVAQNRNRTFMVSILQQNVKYEFPKPFPLKKKMKDYLEEKVDEKYYINSEKAKQLIDKLIANGTLPDRQTDSGFLTQKSRSNTNRKLYLCKI